MEAVAIDTGLDGTKVYPECPCNELKIPLKSQQPIIVSMCHLQFIFPGSNLPEALTWHYHTTSGHYSSGKSNCQVLSSDARDLVKVCGVWGTQSRQ